MKGVIMTFTVLEVVNIVISFGCPKEETVMTHVQ